jgi:hypothetical protein
VRGLLSFPSEVHGERVRLVAYEVARPEVGYAVVRQHDGRRVGTLRAAPEGDAAVILSLCIDVSDRGYGCGSDAAFAFSSAVADAGFTRLRAWAPGELGLAVYFWIRCGLRPLFGPGPDEGIWFERVLQAPPPQSARRAG